jgi:hypothetical protein
VRRSAAGAFDPPGDRFDLPGGLLALLKKHYFQVMTTKFKKTEVQTAPSPTEAQPLSGEAGDMRPAHEVFKALAAARQPEEGGPDGQEPTTFGDWQVKGRCVDF